MEISVWIIVIWSEETILYKKPRALLKFRMKWQAQYRLMHTWLFLTQRQVYLDLNACMLHATDVQNDVY